MQENKGIFGFGYLPRVIVKNEPQRISLLSRTPTVFYISFCSFIFIFFFFRFASFTQFVSVFFFFSRLCSNAHLMATAHLNRHPIYSLLILHCQKDTNVNVCVLYFGSGRYNGLGHFYMWLGGALARRKPKKKANHQRCRCARVGTSLGRMPTKFSIISTRLFMCWIIGGAPNADDAPAVARHIDICTGVFFFSFSSLFLCALSARAQRAHVDFFFFSIYFRLWKVNVEKMAVRKSRRPKKKQITHASQHKKCDMHATHTC